MVETVPSRLRRSLPRDQVARVVDTLRALPETPQRALAAGGRRRASRPTGTPRWCSSTCAGRPKRRPTGSSPSSTRSAALQRAAPGFTVAEFGDASAQHELDDTLNHGFSHAETLSRPDHLPRSCCSPSARSSAAGLPVLLAFSAVLASPALAAVASHLVHASDATSSVMLLMGMAVGVDYSLFYLKREREERRGRGATRCASRGHLGAGRCSFSGMTVLIAMAGMLLAGSKSSTRSASARWWSCS